MANNARFRTFMLSPPSIGVSEIKSWSPNSMNATVVKNNPFLEADFSDEGVGSEQHMACPADFERPRDTSVCARIRNSDDGTLAKIKIFKVQFDNESIFFSIP